MIKALSTITFLAGFCLTIYGQNWTLSGNNIHNNNNGFVGVNNVNPDAYLHIYTNLFDVLGTSGSYSFSVPGPTGLKLVGRSWMYDPTIGGGINEPFPPNHFTSLNNLFEAHIEFGTINGGTTNYSLTRRVTIDPLGRLGIGNNLNPTQDLDVEGNIRMRNGAQAGYIATSEADGTIKWNAPTALGGFWQANNATSPGTGHMMNIDNGEVHIGNVSHALFFDPYLGGGHYSNLSHEGDAGIFFGPMEPEEETVSERGLVIAAINHQGHTKNGLRIDWNGNVSIGDNTDFIINQATNDQYRLAVNGKVIAELVRVKLRGDWPDFVFNKKHDLMPLQELEKYIKKNNHLPDVPNAEQVEKEGIDVGEMNKILLQKIEELTLYVIELEKKIETVNK